MSKNEARGLGCSLLCLLVRRQLAERILKSVRTGRGRLDATVIPNRARKTRDKAKAEAGVLTVERWILAALRNSKFLFLDELNDAIARLLVRLNAKKFQKLEGRSFSGLSDKHPSIILSKPLDPANYSRFSWFPN